MNASNKVHISFASPVVFVLYNLIFSCSAPLNKKMQNGGGKWIWGFLGAEELQDT